MSDELILAIETSCDETSAAVVTTACKILSNIVYSQDAIHAKYGGVVPELASREHITRIDGVVSEALTMAQVSLSDINAVACTYVPGLAGSLLVGLSFAKGLAVSLDKPFIGVDHIKAHLRSYELEYPDIQYPVLGFVVSGGHTLLYHIEDDYNETLLGTTLDDAAGEAMDKVANLLGLGYPGGPIIDRLSRPLPKQLTKFPAVKTKNPYDFSFSGLKTYVLYTLRGQDMRGERRSLTEDETRNLCASFQESVVGQLVDRLMLAISEKHAAGVAVTGGVAANTRLRDRLKKICADYRLNLYVPSARLCTDNAAMIANYAIKLYERGIYSPLDLDAIPTKKAVN